MEHLYTCPHTVSFGMYTTGIWTHAHFSSVSDSQRKLCGDEPPKQEAAPKPDAPKAEEPKPDSPKEAPKQEAVPKPEEPKPEAPKMR